MKAFKARRTSRTSLRAAAAIAAITLGADAAHAAVIERNLPPAETATPTQIAPPAPPAQSDDERLLGPMLNAIVLLGPKDPFKSGAIIGIDASDVARLDTASVDRALAPFLGKPITRKLVSDVAAAIVRLYREKGFPFVSVTVPPQEITAGVVQFRVVEFKLGAVDVKGNRRTPSSYIVGSLRVQPGGPIEAKLLSQDLDALNRYPFRNIQAAFAPGAEFGTTDLELAVSESAPSRLYAGYANSGTRATGWDRFNLGLMVGDMLLEDSVLSYQFTTSANFWDDHGNIFGAAGHPQYLSHAGSFSAPIAPRQFLELDVDAVETSTTAGLFDIGQRTYEATLGYTSAVSNFADLPGDLHLGLEAKRDARSTFFANIKVVDAAVEIYQLYGGWSDAWSDPGEFTALNATVHWSPGGLGGANTKSAFALFAAGNPHGAPNYVYASLAFSHRADLPYGLALNTLILAQLASAALPDTEEAGVGGASLVRGYTLDDGGFDSSIVARNELRLPALGVLSRMNLVDDVLQPYLFADLGHGIARAAHFSTNAQSIGAGADYGLGPWLAASVDGAYALQGAAFTHAGSWRLESRITLSY